jgi:glycosyltransferase involved in cell wall biosynthesis
MGKNNINDMVSVIIPTYNRAKQCKKAVKSVLHQTHNNVEVIVVDDGSEDNTKENLRNLDNRVKYVWQNNSGVVSARNTGLSVYKGGYVAFLDSDDEWLPWKLEAQLSVLHAFPQAGMVWTDMNAVDENGKTIKESYLKTMYSGYTYFDQKQNFQIQQMLSEVWEKCPEIYFSRKCYSGNIFSSMFMGNLVHTSSVLLRRERQKKVGLFDIELIKSGEDYDYHFRTCREGDVAYMDVPSIRYQIGGRDQLTSDEHMIWVARNNLKTVNKMLKIAKKEISLSHSMIKARLAESYAWLGLMEFNQARLKSAWPNLARSLTFRPLQPKIAAYLALSLFPLGKADKLKRAMDVIRRWIRR